MKLRLKYGIALVLITLLLSGAIYGGLEFYKEETLEQNRAAVNETSELAAEQIEVALVERMDYVGFVASQPEAARFDRSGGYLDRILSSTRFSSGQVLAANGTVVAFRGEITRTARFETVGADRSDREYFRQALNRSAYVSEPESVEGTDEYILLFSAPIIRNTDGGDQEVVGVLVLSIDVSERTFFNGVVPIDTSSRSVWVRAGEAVLYESDERFERTTTASTTVEPVGWTLTVSRDRSRLDAHLQWLAIAQGVGLLVVLVSVVSFGAWEYRENLQQTEKLLDGFARLRRGEYEHVVELSAAEEWQQIGDGFNELTDALATREAAIREREQRLDVLNRVLRHNLRNDMNVVLNYAELLAESSDDERVRSAAENIRTVGTDLVETGEKARRLDTALGETEPERLDLAEVAESTLERLGDAYPSTRFNADIPDSASASAIPGVELAIENVCENAVVHNDTPEPRVDVSVDRVDGPNPRVRVRVADDGPGIPEHERAVLDEGTETPLEHGSGLGLWIVQWIVRASGGNVVFESNDPRGTVVTLVFDAA